MNSTGKSKIRKISLLTLGLVIDLKERLSGMMRGRQESTNPKVEKPRDKDRGYEEIIRSDENTPYLNRGVKRDVPLPSDTDNQDVSLPGYPDLQPAYSSDPEESVTLAGEEGDLWEQELDPSMEEDIPLRPSEVDIPHEIQYDEEDDLGVILPGQDKSDSGYIKEEPASGKPAKKGGKR